MFQLFISLLLHLIDYIDAFVSRHEKLCVYPFNIKCHFRCLILPNIASTRPFIPHKVSGTKSKYPKQC